MTWQQGRVTAAIAGGAVLISSAVSLMFLGSSDRHPDAGGNSRATPVGRAVVPREFPAGEVSRLPVPEAAKSGLADASLLPPIPLIARADVSDVVSQVQDRQPPVSDSGNRSADAGPVLSGPRLPGSHESGPRLSRLPLKSAAAPAELPSARDASPILNDLLPPLANGPGSRSDASTTEPPQSNPAWEAAIRELIRQELPQADAQEQEVWLDELKNVPPGMMRDLLRMRQKVGSAAPHLMGPLPDLGLSPLTKPDPVPWTPDSTLPETPTSNADNDASPSRDSLAEAIQPSLRAIDDATRVAMNNIAHARTPGFKRMRVLLSDRPYRIHRSSSSASFEVSSTEAGDSDRPQFASLGQGVRLAATRLDVTPGRLSRTGQPLDVAIDGAGFLQVQRGGKICYTRSGNLTIREDGQLALAYAEGEIALEPAITIPREAASIMIAEDGTVSRDSNGPSSPVAAAASQADRRPDENAPEKPAPTSPQVLGKIQLARFTDPTALQPVGDNLLAATTHSGSPLIAAPGSRGLGHLRQYHLEDSNVDISAEVLHLRELREIAETLRTLTAE